MKVWVLNPPYLKKFSRPQRSPAVTKSGTIYFPIMQASCVGLLEEAGHDVIFTDAPARDMDMNDILKIARDNQPELVVIDTCTPSILNDLSVTEQLRMILPGAFLLLVGTHVSALPDETLLQCSAIDAIARHEYDFTVKDLAQTLAAAHPGLPRKTDLQPVEGLSYCIEGKVIHNPDRPFIENLDELPWVSKVYKKHLRITDYFNPNALYPMVTIVTSRGCPFKCNFCVYPQAMTGRKYRFRSIDDVVDEIEYVQQAFPEVRSIFFEDDTLTANRKRCREFAAAMVERGIKLPWVANSRIEMDLETLRAIKKAGCQELCVGFESGDQDVLDGMHKGTRVERMFQFMRDARKAGVLVHGCFMVGFPNETRAQALKTIDLAMKLGPDTAQFYPVMVYPGTEAYELYKDKGWITAKDYSDWLTPEGLHNCVVRNAEMTSADLVQLCDNARRRFYLRPRYIAYKFGQMIRKPRNIIRTLKAAHVFMKHLIFGSKVK